MLPKLTTSFRIPEPSTELSDFLLKEGSESGKIEDNEDNTLKAEQTEEDPPEDQKEEEGTFDASWSQTPAKEEFSSVARSISKDNREKAMQRALAQTKEYSAKERALLKGYFDQFTPEKAETNSILLKKESHVTKAENSIKSQLRTLGIGE